MTKRWPLIVQYKTGWGWGRWKGSSNIIRCCVVARALGERVAEPGLSAMLTPLDRRLTEEEHETVRRIDRREGNQKDHQMVLVLAKKMGVEP